MSARALSRSLARAATDTGESAAHAAVTIAARWPILMGCLTAPSAAGWAEWNRACAEKLAAAWEGGIAASAAWQATLIQSAFRAPTPLALGNDLMLLTEKALRPARRRVKANAKRLTRAKRG